MLWDAVNWQTLENVYWALQLVYDVVFSPDGTRLVSGGEDDTIRVWDVRDWRIAISANSTFR